MAWAIDLDGVIWRGGRALDGSADAVSYLRSRGIDVCFVTNSSWRTRSDYLTKLDDMGITTPPERLIHSGDALSKLVTAGEKVLVCAGEAAVEGLRASGADIIRVNDVGDEVPKVDSVVVAWMADNDYRKLVVATTAVLAGARLLAPNMDPLYPTAEGFVPGSGALASAVAYATGRQVVVAGKPNDAMVSVVEQRCGPIDVMVGDQVATDGALAVKLGAKFGLVHSGVTPADHGPLDPTPDFEASDLRSLVAKMEV